MEWCVGLCARAHMGHGLMGVIAETKTTLEVYDLHCSNDVFLLGPKDLSDLLQAVIQRQWWGAFSERASMQQWTDLGIPLRTHRHCFSSTLRKVTKATRAFN